MSLGWPTIPEPSPEAVAAAEQEDFNPAGTPTRDRRAILDLLQTEGPALRARYSVAALALFGSMARGDDHARSDVYLIVTFAEGQTNFDNFMGLKLDLQDLFGRRVDLLTERSLDDPFRSRISQDLLHVG